MAESVTLEMSQIVRNPDAIRTVDKTEEDWLPFVADVRTNGVLQAILVRPAPDNSGKFILIDGDHRFSAAEECGLTKINAVVDNCTEEQAYFKQASLNFHRITTKPAQYAQHLHRILGRCPTMTIPSLAAQLSVSVSWLNQRLKLVNLNPDIAAAVDRGEITVTNACALAELPVEEQINWFDRAMTEQVQTFRPAVEERNKELRKAAKEGREATGPAEFTPRATLRKLSEFKDALASDNMISEIIAGETSPFAAAKRVAQWALNLDPSTVAGLKAAYDEKLEKRKADKAKGEAERKAKAVADAEAKAAALKAKYGGAPVATA